MTLLLLTTSDWQLIAEVDHSQQSPQATLDAGKAACIWAGYSTRLDIVCL